LLNAPISDQPFLGVFSDDHIPYYIDRANNTAIGKKTPSLETMTTAALDRLSRNPSGFVLQIEAGRVDHAAHAMDSASIIPEQLEFDRAIEVVRKFAEQHGDTLVVVTTDHGTGGFMLNGAYDGYENAIRFLYLGKCKGSYTSIKDRVDMKNLQDTLVPAVESTFDIKLNLKEQKQIFTAIENPVVERLNAFNRIAYALRPIFMNRYSVSWTSGNHTGDLVELAMFGPGSDILPGYLENWQLHGVFREVLGI
jgi:alkaline phosphatase